MNCYTCNQPTSEPITLASTPSLTLSERRHVGALAADKAWDAA